MPAGTGHRHHPRHRPPRHPRGRGRPARGGAIHAAGSPSGGGRPGRRPSARRRAVALRTAARNHLLVGPDNGLLALAAERLGGVVEAVDIGQSPHRLEPVCATFHGRDIFAPVAAALAGGAQLGRRASRSRRPTSSASTCRAAACRGRDADRPGPGDRPLRQHASSTSTATRSRAFGLTLGALGRARGRRRASSQARYVYAFGEGAADEILLYEDAQQQLAIAINRGLGRPSGSTSAWTRRSACGWHDRRRGSARRGSARLRACTCAGPTRPATGRGRWRWRGAPARDAGHRRRADGRPRATGPDAGAGRRARRS